MKRKIALGICYIALALSLFVLGAIIYSYVADRNSEEDKVGIETETQADSMNTETSEDIASEEDTGSDSIREDENEDTEAESTTLIFAGDLIYGTTFKANYSDGGIKRVVSEELIQEMNEADITMVNEEFPFGTRGTPMEDKKYTFRADPSYVESFQTMGIDIVTLANNHALDYGPDALYDTFETLDEAGILYVGAGESEERAAELQIIEMNGKKFGFLAASRVIPVVNWNVQNRTPGVLATYDPERLNRAIEEADAQCDVLTVYVHWGIEMAEYPEEYQRSLAQGYIDAGADVIIGSHPHVLQGVEYIDGVPVFYSLGNFVSTPTKDKTMLVKLTVDADDEITAQIVPATTVNGQTRRMDELEQQVLNDYMESISFGITIDDAGVIIP